VRHPLLDLRLIRFLMEVPPLPWFGNKTLPRVAYAGRLPAEVLNREKQTFPGDRLQAALMRGDGLHPPEILMFQNTNGLLQSEQLRIALTDSHLLDDTMSATLQFAISLERWLRRRKEG
jgi:asparagine synthase (glutamine-hydrolysing)